MNMQLGRKQILILGIAMLLAVASFWIPTPPQSSPQSSTPERSMPVGGSGSAEAIVFAREPATTRRFAVSEEIPKTMPSDWRSIARSEDAPSAEIPPDKQFLDPRDLANGDAARLGDVLLVPVKNPDPPRKP